MKPDTPVYALFFFLMIRRPPRSTPFPYTTLSRSVRAVPPQVGLHQALGNQCSVRGRDADGLQHPPAEVPQRFRGPPLLAQDRKSTRLNSSHANISYAVFCLKKKTNHATVVELTVN